MASRTHEATEPWGHRGGTMAVSSVRAGKSG